jgi:hypothetical protein
MLRCARRAVAITQRTQRSNLVAVPARRPLSSQAEPLHPLLPHQLHLLQLLTGGPLALRCNELILIQQKLFEMLKQTSAQGSQATKLCSKWVSLLSV